MKKVIQSESGNQYFIIDNEDKTADKYYQNFGTQFVKMFNKKKYADECDECNNFDERRTITMARNACFDIAKEIGVTYFIELDDDYTSFEFRYADENDTRLLVKRVENFNHIISLFLNFYISTNFLSIAFAQGGDFIGGESCGLLKNYMYNGRKCMNSFFCSTERRFWFLGQLNEDVNTYVTYGNKGGLFLTIPFVGLEQKATQLTTGGMTDAYLKYGTYVKSFTTVMMQPSSVFVAMMGFTKNRLHHRVIQRNTVPMIVKEMYKK
jgi:hypothetical protein